MKATNDALRRKFNEGLGRRLKLARRLNNLTQGEVAEACGMNTHGGMSLLEHGGKGIHAYEIPAVCKLLRISPEWLLGLNDDGPHGSVIVDGVRYIPVTQAPGGPAS